ncbi:MAG: RNB domain-containing ribonuclease, partial [Anaerovoracaceae bacterium]
MGRIIKGVFSKNRRGFGFVEIADSDENERDIYIAPADQKDAMTGDTVTVDLIPEIYWEGSRPEGIITKIDRRSITHVTGTYIKRKKYSVVLPISEKEGIPVLVNRNDSSGAGSGDKVTVEILKYPEKGRDAVGRVVAIIAGKDDPAGDIKALIRSKNLSFSFPDEVKSQASDIEKAGITAAEIEGRRDLRERNIFTIDGADSKDFDDAVSVNLLDNGNYLLGVHIADVSHYVTEDSPLDREALKRGNSVYVLNQVVPMLPVELSNGICSLNEGVERLTLTCEMEVTPHGDVVSHDIFE